MPADPIDPMNADLYGDKDDVNDQKIYLEDVLAIHSNIKKGKYFDIIDYLESFDEDYQMKLINCNIFKETNYQSAMHVAALHHHPRKCGCTEYEHCGKNYFTENLYAIIRDFLGKGGDIFVKDGEGYMPIDYITSELEPFMKTNPAFNVRDILAEHH